MRKQEQGNRSRPCAKFMKIFGKFRKSDDAHLMKLARKRLRIIGKLSQKTKISRNFINSDFANYYNYFPVISEIKLEIINTFWSI